MLSFNTEESVCLAKQKILDALPKVTTDIMDILCTTLWPGLKVCSDGVFLVNLKSGPKRDATFLLLSSLKHLN